MKAKFVIAILLITATSCKKEGSSLQTQIEGKWELSSAIGGWTGQQEYPEGNGNTFVFTGNSFMQKIKQTDTTFTYTGTFRIYKGKACEYAPEQMLFEIDGNSFPSTISISNNELTLGTIPECIADGVSSTYRKISN